MHWPSMWVGRETAHKLEMKRAWIRDMWRTGGYTARNSKLKASRMVGSRSLITLDCIVCRDAAVRVDEIFYGLWVHADQGASNVDSRGIMPQYVNEELSRGRFVLNSLVFSRNHFGTNKAMFL